MRSVPGAEIVELNADRIWESRGPTQDAGGGAIEAALLTPANFTYPATWSAAAPFESARHDMSELFYLFTRPSVDAPLGGGVVG